MEILPKYYTVNFVGEGVGIEPQSITHGNYATAPENPEREGYDFGGWFTDNGTFANQWDFKTNIVTQDTTLYAKWEENTLDSPSDALDNELLIGKWELYKLVDLQTPSFMTKPDKAAKVVIHFLDFSTFTAHSVNTFKGKYTLSSDSIRFIHVEQTLIYMLSNEWERYFGSALGSTDLIKIKNGRLFIFYDQSEKVMVFNKLN